MNNIYKFFKDLNFKWSLVFAGVIDFYEKIELRIRYNVKLE